MSIHTHLSLAAGKYSQPPNMVLVPRNRKTFPVKVEFDCETDQTRVFGSPDKAETLEWCVLDENLRQVMVGGGGKKADRDRYVTRTVMGGGALNPEDLTVEMVAAKLKNGAGYSLVCQSYGVTAVCDFVAIHEPATAVAKSKPAKKKAKVKKRAVKKKAATRKG